MVALPGNGAGKIWTDAVAPKPSPVLLRERRFMDTVSRHAPPREPPPELARIVGPCFSLTKTPTDSPRPNAVVAQMRVIWTQ